ncbi:MAG: glycosyltransferase [Gemmatimonadaceae bacterium]|jgi:colanic acid/amylovoran biosynthesis glycosyltransferase
MIDPRSIVVFRRTILPWSETFVASQQLALTRFHPVFVGYARDAKGARLVEGHPTVLLSAHHVAPPLGKALLKYLGIVPGAWREAIAATKPALVHAYFGSGAIPAGHLARRLGVPLVVSYLGMDITVTPRSQAEVRRRRRAFAMADRVLCVSEFLARKLREAGCPPEKIQVHYTGVDVTKFVPSGEPPVPDQVLFVGRLAAKKGVIHLLRAMVTVQRTVPHAECVIAGDGPLRGELEGAAAALGVRARFLGVQTPAQVNALMQRATVLCGPSVVDARGNAEGLPFTFLEAQACGCPVVVSTSGGTAEGVADGETGYCVAPGDEGALADRLLRILTDPARRAQMSQAARAHMERAFNLRTQTAVLEGIYDDVIARAAHR